MAEEQSRFAFLYRQDQGRIDRATFLKAAAPIVIGLLVMTAIWIAIMPDGARDLTHDPFFDGKVAATYVYLLIYALALMMGAVMLTFLGAKRLRDVGRPTWLAGLPYLALFLDGAAHWLHAHAPDALPGPALFALDVAAIAALAWAVIDMGFRKSRI